MLYSMVGNYMDFVINVLRVSTGASSTPERVIQDQVLENELCPKTNGKHGGYERDSDRQRHADGMER